MLNPDIFQQDQFNFPLSFLEEKIISKIHREVKKRNSITGAWTDQQNLIYAQFIEDHPFEFQTAQKRRRFKVFEAMALKLKNRTAIQCRSHNQKIVKLAGSIMKVPQYIKRRLSNLGRKMDSPIQINEQKNEIQSEVNKEKSSVTNKEQPNNQNQNLIKKENRFELPLKLCIEICSDKIEQYC